MKFPPRDNRSAVSAWLLTLALTVAALIPLLLYARIPSWWSERGVLLENATADDYAPVNQGQLKNIAKAAVAEMDAKLSGGAGDELHTLIESWSNPGPAVNDFAPLNLGQLKNMAKPFYDRMIQAGLVDYYPWLRSPDAADDFAIANIGQTKNLFSFEIPRGNSLNDALGDRLAAAVDGGSLALLSSAVWNWGGPLNAGNIFERNYPQRVTGLSGVNSVAVGGRHLLALDIDGRVWTWGENDVGQLGDGTNTSRATPAALPYPSDIVSIKAGWRHTLALKRDGTVFSWGYNRSGQLGTGDVTNSSSPTPVAGLDDVQKVSAGSERSLAIRSDGTLWIWGYHHYAQELGKDIFHTTPVLVSGLTDVVDVTSGFEHMVAVKADGTVWAWGANSRNQVGNGNPWWIFQDTPSQVSNLSHIVKVASCGDHTLALSSEGLVWAWGYNANGQLGDGTNLDRQGPVQVVGLTDVVAIATAHSYSLAIKSDGTVWAWGDGAVGTLPGFDRYVPQQVVFGLNDTNHNGMDDRWEIVYFGNLDQAGDADFDGDGISNLQEFLRGTDPRDFFNGVPPVIEIVSGNNQFGDPGKLLPKPVTVRVRNIAGQPQVNAPVDFMISNGAGLITPKPGEPLRSQFNARTDSLGQASAYVLLPEVPGTSIRITASPAIPNSSVRPGSVTFRASARLVPPSTPTPVPDSSATPTPTPSPTATPLPPYRYAIIDLGKDLYPIRVNNKGVILLAGIGPDGNWGYYRWKGGTLEPLTYSGAHSSLEAKDINDQGEVVGTFARSEGPWNEDGPNELRGGLRWPGNRSTADKISAPGAFPGFGPYSWYLTFQSASLTAINSKGDAFGEIATGSVRGFLWSTHFVLNSARVPAGATAPIQISNATAINDSEEHFLSHWTGSSDTIARASKEHYIGRKLIPFADNYIFLDDIPGDRSGMIDGQAVHFDPVDLNEAGVVVGNSIPSGSMVIRTPRPSPNPSATPAPGAPEYTEKILEGGSPVAINDHALPFSSAGAQISPIPSPSPNSSPGPSPSPVPAPQILGWLGSAIVIWERQQDRETWHPFGLEEMIPTMDGWEYLEPYDMNDNGTIVGVAWYTDPSNPQAEGAVHAFLLVPAELIPDFDRNGVINYKDSGRVTETEPWRFWINDDDDAGAVDGNDIPGLADSDAKDAGLGTFRVDGVRDLVDFFPLYLNLKQIVEVLPPAQFSYFLKHEQGALNFAYTDLKPGGGKDERAGAYLKNLGAAQKLQSAELFQISAAGVHLTTAFLNKIKDKDEDKGVILIEGRSPTDKPLVLEVRQGSEKIAELAFQVKIDGVEQMFRHKNLLAAGGGSGGLPDRLGEPANYPDSQTSNKSFVIVHGYNVNSEATRGWGAEMFKRLYWTGSNAKFYNVTWYGSETQIGGSLTTDYQANVDNAFATAQQFTSFLTGLSNATVAAHSLGNILVGSAIQDWGARPSTYFMIDAAVAMESYDETEEQLSNGGVIGMEHPEWSAYNRRLWASNWHLLFTAGDNRQTLKWGNRLENVGSVPAYNFYSTGEEVLKNPSSSPSLPLSADEVWNNQERMKGRMLTGQVLSSNYGGWGFSNYWDGPDTNAEPDLVYRRRFPDETIAITEAQLRTNPFFRPGPTELYGTNGSNYASPQQRRNTLLAEMIPALSFAAGSNRLESFGDNGNFDMPSIYAEGWPPERAGNTKWFHSDVKVVAYTYIYRLYEEFVALGGLDQ